MEGSRGGKSYKEVPKASVAQRYKLGWRFLCISNLALGAYIFSKTPKKEKKLTANKAETNAPAEPVVEKSTPPKGDVVDSPPIPVSVIERQPVIVREFGAERESISAYQQRELFKWMLEEKMKTKPNNRQEKERIDEEKALLEQFIRTMGFSVQIFEPKVDQTKVAGKVETKYLTKPVVVTSTLTEREPLIEQQPAAKLKPSIEREPVIQHNSVTQRKPAMQHGSAIPREPMAEDEPVTERESVTQHEPVKESESTPVTESEPVIQHEYVMEHKPVTEHQLIPVYQQQELFKWMLDEKMKTKPSKQEEEERINEEKALLENYIRALSFSSHMLAKERKNSSSEQS